jgi:hypothetical protein
MRLRQISHCVKVFAFEHCRNAVFAAGARFARAFFMKNAPTAQAAAKAAASEHFRFMLSAFRFIFAAL